MATPPRGANIVSQSLDAAGVKTVFSLSGNHIRSIDDATIEANPEIIHVRHEAAAVHMAVPFARLTGKVAVALASTSSSRKPCRVHSKRLLQAGDPPALMPPWITSRHRLFDVAEQVRILNERARHVCNTSRLVG